MKWDVVWQSAGDSLARDIADARGHWLTEDSLRRAVAEAIVAQGIPPARVIYERRQLRSGSVDLVIDAPLEAAIELKFPRDPRSSGAADTMTYGELLKDFYGLATLDVPERWAVHLIGARLRRYLTRRSELTWVWEPGEQVTLPLGLVDRLPVTAGGMLFAYAQAAASFECTFARSAGEDLTLATYRATTVALPK